MIILDLVSAASYYFSLRRIKWGVFLFLITCAVLTSGCIWPGESESSLLFTGDFETGDLSQFNDWKKEFGSNHSGNVVSTPTRCGNHSMCFILKHDDPLVSNSKGAELSNFRNKDPIGSERWYGISVYIPKDWEYDIQLESIAQWHATPDKKNGGNPHLKYG